MACHKDYLTLADVLGLTSVFTRYGASSVFPSLCIQDLLISTSCPYTGKNQCRAMSNGTWILGPGGQRSLYDHGDGNYTQMRVSWDGEVTREVESQYTLP